MPNKTVAIVDDDHRNAWALSLIMKDWGLRALFSSDGQTMIRQLRSQHETPDLLITDYHLAKEDGLEVARHFRREFGSQLKVLIITGTGQIGDIVDSAPSDIPILTKPVDPKTLKSYVFDNP